MAQVFKTPLEQVKVMESPMDDMLGKEYHDIDSRQWFKLNKIDGNRVHLTSPNGYRTMTMDEFKKMIARSPLNKPNTWTQKVVNGGK